MLGKPLTTPLAAPSRVRDVSYWFDIVFGRTVPAIVFSIFLGGRFLIFVEAVRTALQPGRADPRQDLFNVSSQVLILIFYVMLVLLYTVRLPKRAGDARPPVIAVSFFGSFAIFAVALLPGVPRREWLLPYSDLLLLLGLLYTVWALAYLRRSFSILPEARRLVTGGPYRLSRHPLYLGELSAAVAPNLLTISWPGLLLVILILGAQVARIRAEERVLGHQFPQEYAAYKRRTPRYLPRPWLLLGR